MRSRRRRGAIFWRFRFLLLNEGVIAMVCDVKTNAKDAEKNAKDAKEPSRYRITSLNALEGALDVFVGVAEGDGAAVGAGSGVFGFAEFG